MNSSIIIIKLYILLFLLKLTSSEFFYSTSNIGNNNDIINDIYYSQNNTYIIGTFYSTTITLGSCVLNNYNSGTSDAFIFNINSNNNTCIWGMNIGGSTNELGISITIDKNNQYLFAVGQFTSTTIQIGSFTLTNTGSTSTNDIFIFKLNLIDNNVAWAKSIGKTSDDFITSIINNNNYLYISGYYCSTSIILGNFTLNNPSAPLTDIFIAKLNSFDGTFLLANKIGGTNTDKSVKLISTNNENTIAFIGNYLSNSFTLDSFVLTNSGGTYNTFITELNTTTFNYTWVLQTTGSNNELSSNLYYDINGNIYIIGYYTSNPMIFGSFSLSNTGSTSTYDTFIVRINGLNKTVDWLVNCGGTSDDKGTSMDFDSNGNIYITGYYSSILMNFSSTISIRNNASSLTNDIFIASLNSTSGVFTSAMTFGGNSHEQNPLIKFINNNQYYLFGVFYSSIMQVESFILTNTGTVGTSDFFILKYNIPFNIDTSANVDIPRTNNNNTNNIYNIQTSTNIITDDRNQVYLEYFLTNIGLNDIYNLITVMDILYNSAIISQDKLITNCLQINKKSTCNFNIPSLKPNQNATAIIQIFI
jgi:hypothetical protein